MKRFSTSRRFRSMTFISVVTLLSLTMAGCAGTGSSADNTFSNPMKQITVSSEMDGQLAAGLLKELRSKGVKCSGQVENEEPKQYLLKVLMYGRDEITYGESVGPNAPYKFVLELHDSGSDQKVWNGLVEIRDGKVEPRRLARALVERMQKDTILEE